MRSTGEDREHAHLLRRRAEEALRGQPVELDGLPVEDIQHLLHELQVHQAELSIQNEELRRTQLELEISRDLYSDLYDSAPIGYCTLSRRGHVLEANRTLAALLGVERDQLIHQPLSRYVERADQDKFYLHCQRTFADPHRQVDEIQMVKQTGDGFSVHLESLIAPGDPNQMRIMVSDITERKQAEAALRLSEIRLGRLVEANIIGVITRDAAGHIKEANDVFLTMIGHTSEEVQAGKLHMKDLVAEEFYPLEQQIVKDVLSNGSSKPFEKEYIHKDGRRVPTLVGYTGLEGSPDDLIGFVLDLTELKQVRAALQDYVEKLKRSNQDLEQFAYVASHDLQEPLRKIRQFGSSLERQIAGNIPEEAADTLNRINTAAERMQRMIDGLLDLSRVNRTGSTFEPVVLSHVAEEAVSDLEARIRATGGAVHIEDLPTIEADRTQIRRMFQNLIGNALKFHKPDVPPIVRVSGALYHSGMTPGIILTVQDNGIGFDEQYRERIFQAFQRLHGRNEYEGTGLGLSICQKIVERHHGKIEVHSTIGEGSTFTIHLPVQQPA